MASDNLKLKITVLMNSYPPRLVKAGSLAHARYAIAQAKEDGKLTQENVNRLLDYLNYHMADYKP